MHYPTIILGAGAAGMMAAAQAGPGTLVLDHARAPGEKIRISGGGRCNFTNLHAGPENFLSANPHFCKSALARYDQHDFIALVDRHRIAWHEKTLGQLFCDGSARQIIDMLLAEMRGAGAELRLETAVTGIAHGTDGFTLTLDGAAPLTCRNLVVATGGKSIPKMGASGFAYRIAEQFGHEVTETRPALVPLTFGPDVLALTKPLAGVSLPARVSAEGAAFDEALLFTHRGLSGPAILQASSYWREGAPIRIDLLPGQDALAALKAARAENGRRAVGTALAGLLPNRLAAAWAEARGLTGQMANIPDRDLAGIAAGLSDWQLTPAGSEGYRTAEVTLGGIDTDGLDARSMESKRMKGLFFIGEAVDVTGWLGGYNFQWAWSSGWAAGRAIAERRA